MLVFYTPKSTYERREAENGKRLRKKVGFSILKFRNGRHKAVKWSHRMFSFWFLSSASEGEKEEGERQKVVKLFRRMLSFWFPSSPAKGEKEKGGRQKFVKWFRRMLSFWFSSSTVEGGKLKYKMIISWIFQLSRCAMEGGKEKDGRRNVKGQCGCFKEFLIPKVRSRRRKGGIWKA